MQYVVEGKKREGWRWGRRGGTLGRVERDERGRGEIAEAHLIARGGDDISLGSGKTQEGYGIGGWGVEIKARIWWNFGEGGPFHLSFDVPSEITKPKWSRVWRPACTSAKCKARKCEVQSAKCAALSGRGYVRRCVS